MSLGMAPLDWPTETAFKQREKSMDEIRKIIAGAIHSAFVDYPARDDGTRWDKIYKEPAECELLTNAVLNALKKHGYEVAKPS
jgi:hypothetical protein